MALRTLPSPWLVLTLFAVVSSCQQNESTCHSESAKLFGQPSENTGYLKLSVHLVAIIVVELSLSLQTTLLGLSIGSLARQHQNPPQRLGTDPYSSAFEPEVSSAEQLCIAVFEADGTQYRLETHAEDSWVPTESQFITHRDGCGQCSSLQDLAVYMGDPDLTGPVRRAGLRVSPTGRRHSDNVS